MYAVVDTDFCSILLKFGQKICFDDLLDEFENWCYKEKKLDQQDKS